jgi:hypothetical protein
VRRRVLQVAVVGAGEPLQRRQQPRQAPGCLARHRADELERVRVLLLGHDRGGRGVVVRELEVAPVREDDHVLREPRERRRERRHRRGGLNEEVAGSDRVGRVRDDPVEAEQLGRALAVDVERRPGERGRAERRAVHALERVEQALGVASERRLVGQQVVSDRRRLGVLEVREAGHRRPGVLRRCLCEHRPQVTDRGGRREEVPAQAVADARRDLVVARAGGVHLPAVGADLVDDRRLDGLVDVLALGQGRVALDLDDVQRREYLPGGLVVDDPLLGEHDDVRTVDGHVGREDALVVRKRREEATGRAAAEAVAADRSPVAPAEAVGVVVEAEVPVVAAETGHLSRPR